MRRLAEGRGTGHGRDFKPWLTTRDFSSRGRVHRIPGLKTGRVHNFFSDLEKNVFLIVEWPDQTEDIREQFPLLPVEETLQIARELGVKHPSHPVTGEPVVMTTDIVRSLSHGCIASLGAISAKYSSEAGNARVLEKASIEHAYWARRSVPFFLVTEREIPTDLVKNLEWIRGAWDLGICGLTAADICVVARRLTGQLCDSDSTPLYQVCLTADQHFGIQPGTSLNIARHSLVKKWWRVPLRERLRPNQPLVGLRVDPRAPWLL